MKATPIKRTLSALSLIGATGAMLAASTGAYAAGGTVFGGERFTDPDSPRSVLRVAVSCDAADANKEGAKAPSAWSLLVAGKRAGKVGRVIPSAPDDIPLDLFLVLPRDLTMLDAHESLMEQLTQLPYWLNAMGHRRHRIHVITYSGCPNGAVPGERSSRLVAETGNSIQQGIISSDPKRMLATVEAIKHDNNNKDRKTCGSKFAGVEFNTLLRDLVGMFSETFTLGKRERGRLVFIMHDGRNVDEKQALTNPEVDKMVTIFDQTVLLQPDIAPLIWAKEVYRGSGPAGRLAKNFFRSRIQQDLYRDCIALRGRTACLTADQKTSRRNAANQIMATVSPRTLTGSINHRQFITRSSLITLLSGSARLGSGTYTGKAKEVDKAFKRPTGLDKLGCRLAEIRKGGLELLGGYPGQKLSCQAAKNTDEAAGTLAEVIERNSPFAKSFTVEVCLDEGDKGLEGEVPYRVEMNSQLCVEGRQNFKSAATSASNRMAPKAVIQSVCGMVAPANNGNNGAKVKNTKAAIDYKWIGLAAIAGLILGMLIMRGR